MRKFSSILESAQSDETIEIKTIMLELRDCGFDLVVKENHGVFNVSLSVGYGGIADAGIIEIAEMISLAGERIKELGLEYEGGTVNISGESFGSRGKIDLQYRKKGFSPSKDVHGWKEFKAYCQKVLGIDGMEGAREGIYFRINVVDKDNGWPTLKDDMVGWSIDVDKEEQAAFIAQFPGYEAFLKNLLDRQINYSLVWHLVSDEGDRHHRISDPAKLEEAKRSHNPMKFDREGIEAVETLLEMSRKFPGCIEIKKHRI